MKRPMWTPAVVIPASLRRQRAVIVALLLFICASAGCDFSHASKKSRPDKAARQKGSGATEGGTADPAAAGKVLARLADPSITESSGLAASRRNPDLLWTHNDSGDDPFVYAIDLQGKTRGVWKVEGARARDWEDIAVGPGPERGRSYLYIGDIGNNSSAREQVLIYRVPEPAIEAGDAPSSRTSPRLTETAEVIRVKYPDGTHNAEALMVHPQTGDIYIVTKTTEAASGVYKLSAPVVAGEVSILKHVGNVTIPSLFGAMITGGDISPDGRSVVLCDYINAYELRLDGQPSSTFDSIWQQPPTTIPLISREQGEAICYRLDGAAILATSEGRSSPLIEVKLR